MRDFEVRYDSQGITVVVVDGGEEKFFIPLPLKNARFLNDKLTKAIKYVESTNVVTCPGCTGCKEVLSEDGNFWTLCPTCNGKGFIKKI